MMLHTQARADVTVSNFCWVDHWNMSGRAYDYTVGAYFMLEKGKLSILHYSLGMFLGIPWLTDKEIKIEVDITSPTKPLSYRLLLLLWQVKDANSSQIIAKRCVWRKQEPWCAWQQWGMESEAAEARVDPGEFVRARVCLQNCCVWCNDPRFSGPCLLISCWRTHERGKREAGKMNVIGLPAECSLSHLSQSLPSHLTSGGR